MDLTRLRRFAPVVATLLAMAATTAWIRVLRGSLMGVQGSTEAWLMAHVQRVQWFGDFGQAVVASRIPNTYSNALYPWLVAQLSRDVPTAMVVGHAVSAAALGASAVALWGIWREAVGPRAAVAGAAATFLPAAVAMACQARYESPALALVLLVIWASSVAWRAPGRSLAWPAAGALVALTFVTREYLGLLGLGALGIASVAHIVQRRQVLGPAMALVQVLLVTIAASFLLELSPLEGLRTVGGYAVQDVDSRPMLAEVLGPWGRRALMALGAVGWVLAYRRAPVRGGLLVPALVIGPFLVLPLFPQQSPQYYLLGSLLLGSGVAGLVLLAPRALQVPAGVVLALGLAGWSTAVVPGALAAPGTVTNLHVESSGRSDADLLPTLDWAQELSQGHILVLSSHWVENIDAYAELHLARPVAFVYPTQRRQLPEMTAAARGRSIVLVVVEEEHHVFEPVDGQRIDTFRAGPLAAEAYLLEPGPEHGPDLCAGRYAMRGFCTQRDWLDGGGEGLRTQGAALRTLWGPLLSFYGPSLLVGQSRR